MLAGAAVVYAEAEVVALDLAGSLQGLSPGPQIMERSVGPAVNAHLRLELLAYVHRERPVCKSR